MTNAKPSTVHDPVLLEETLELLAIRRGGRYIDGTVGGGGHTEAIARRTGPEGFVLGLDRDPEALARAGDRLANCEGGARFDLVRGNFKDLAQIAESRAFGLADGILLDLGVSSDQIDCPQRGFSFMRNGPLDMRMDPDAEVTAAALVAHLGEEALAKLFRDYGEERMARRIARGIVRERERHSIETTEHLARITEIATGGKREKIHPATRVFQALRIAVNGEMENLHGGLKAGLEILKAGGRMAVITFHSLEDREVKRRFRDHAGRMKALQAGGEIWEGLEPRVRILTRKPVVAASNERERNPRSRSAKLRAAEKLAAHE